MLCNGRVKHPAAVFGTDVDTAASIGDGIAVMDKTVSGNKIVIGIILPTNGIDMGDGDSAITEDDVQCIPGIAFGQIGMADHVSEQLVHESREETPILRGQVRYLAADADGAVQSQLLHTPLVRVQGFPELLRE